VCKELRRIFGPKSDEVTGELRKLHNEELNDPYSSPDIVLVIKARRMRWAGNVARMGERKGFCWGNLRGKDHFGRPRLRWDDQVKTDLQDVGWGYGLD